jgi:single-strand DNA-binding protein
MKTLFQTEGHLGKDPVIKSLSSGRQVTRFSVASNKKWKKGNQMKSVTDWFQVEAWGNLAVPASRLKKGDPVFIQGELRTGSYTKDNVMHQTTTVIVANLRLLDYSIFAKEEVPDTALPEETEELDDPGAAY